MFSAVSWRSFQLIVGALILIASSGCAVGNKHQYADATPNLQIENGHATAVSVQDRRPYVLDGDKDPDFVGVQRGGFGNPFDVTTASGKPLAADMSEAVVAALKKKNLTAAAVSVAPDATDATIKEIIASASAERLLIIKLLEWKSDTYQNTALIYHVELSVPGLRRSAAGGEDGSRQRRSRRRFHRPCARKIGGACCLPPDLRGPAQRSENKSRAARLALCRTVANEIGAVKSIC